MDIAAREETQIIEALTRTHRGPTTFLSKFARAESAGPLVGDMPVDEAWNSVHLLSDRVLPQLN